MQRPMFWLIIGWVVAVNKGEVFLCHGAATLVVQYIWWQAHNVHLQFYCRVHVYYHARWVLMDQIHHIMLGMQRLEVISKQIWCANCMTTRTDPMYASYTQIFKHLIKWEELCLCSVCDDFGWLMRTDNLQNTQPGVHKKLLSCHRALGDLNLTQWESPFLYSPWQRRIKSPSWPCDWKHSYHHSHL